ncbi:MAG: hypothetical protein IJS42_05635 [Synergistaceae bacterium]|nr:hypothetical protein [Synergistaceae bacterium]
MSNPAVISLANKYIHGRHVWLDDNIGETIHIHIDAFRIDLTNEEFALLCDDICDAINELICVPGFDCHKIDPIYFETELSHWLNYLQSVKLDKVRLGDIICSAWSSFDDVKKLPDSWGVRVLNGEVHSHILKNSSLHSGQTDTERFESAFMNIKEYGYPYNGEYIYLFDNNVISDGHHRAASLWKLLGDSEIPVMRLYFSDKFNLHHVQANRWKRTFAFRFALRVRNFFSYLLHDQKTFARKIYDKVRAVRNYFIEKKYEHERKKHFTEHDIFSRK